MYQTKSEMKSGAFVICPVDAVRLKYEVENIQNILFSVQILVGLLTVAHKKDGGIAKEF